MAALDWATRDSGVPADTAHSHSLHGSIRWIDVCKGIGIVLVVAGHKLKMPQPIVQFLYLFHMPLFFVLSGYLFKAQRSEWDYAYKKAIHLLVPYAVFFLSLLPRELFYVLHHHEPIGGLLLHLAWGGDRTSGDYSVFWFVPCLFLTQQLMNVLLANMRMLAVLPVMVISLSASYFLSARFPHFDLPLNAHVVLASSPLFFAGYVMRRYAVLENKWFYCLSIAGVACAVIVLWLGIDISYDMHNGVYGVPFLSFALSLCCIQAVVFASKAICMIPVAEGILASFGSLSMGIMFIHNPLFVPRLASRLIPDGGMVSFMLILCLSYGLAFCLSKNRIARALYLGSERDFRTLLNSHSASELAT